MVRHLPAVRYLQKVNRRHPVEWMGVRQYNKYAGHLYGPAYLLLSALAASESRKKEREDAPSLNRIVHYVKLKAKKCEVALLSSAPGDSNDDFIVLSACS